MKTGDINYRASIFVCSPQNGSEASEQLIRDLITRAIMYAKSRTNLEMKDHATAKDAVEMHFYPRVLKGALGGRVHVCTARAHGSHPICTIEISDTIIHGAPYSNLCLHAHVMTIIEVAQKAVLEVATTKKETIVEEVSVN